jgi:hypothetical protein
VHGAAFARSEESSSAGALQCVEQRSDESTQQTWTPGAFWPEANCQHAPIECNSQADPMFFTLHLHV